MCFCDSTMGCTKGKKNPRLARIWIYKYVFMLSDLLRSRITAENNEPRIKEMERPSPGLQMHHGFLRKIEQNQYSRERQVREDADRRRETSKLARQVGLRPSKDSKPAREIYRPPSLRSAADDFNVSTHLPVNGEFHSHPESLLQPRNYNNSSNNNNHHHHPHHHKHEHQRPAFNSDQDELAADEHRRRPMVMHDLSKSRSTTAAHRVRFQDVSERWSPPAEQLRSSNHAESSATSAHAFGLPHQSPSAFGLKRSKSLGAANGICSFLSDLDFSILDVESRSAIFKATENPNMLHAREMMEIVRHLFSCALESDRFAEPIVSVCIQIIVRENTDTFVETLLNSCREWFLERSREESPAINPNRMVAYTTFLYELYTRLLGRKQPPSSRPGTAGSGVNSPATIILALLSECCHLLMQPSALFHNSEIECLFVMLTKIGRDLQTEHPQRMQQLMSSARCAFVASNTPRSTRKILMQLIEMSASNWQLASSAVAYYYPSRQ